jgi:hypothetical protein
MVFNKIKATKYSPRKPVGGNRFLASKCYTDTNQQVAGFVARRDRK